MTVQDILKLEPNDVMKLNRKQLAVVVQTASAVANKRIDRLERNNLKTPAYNAIQTNGGKFSTRGKNLNELRSEYSRVRDFLNAKTSTIKGAKKVKHQMEQRIGGVLSPAKMNDLWDAYSRLDTDEHNFLQLYGSDQMQQYLRNVIYDDKEHNLDVDAIVEMGKQKLKEEYEIKGNDYDDGLGEFFE